MSDEPIERIPPPPASSLRSVTFRFGASAPARPATRAISSHPGVPARVAVQEATRPRGGGCLGGLAIGATLIATLLLGWGLLLMGEVAKGTLDAPTIKVFRGAMVVLFAAAAVLGAGAALAGLLNLLRWAGGRWLSALAFLGGLGVAVPAAFACWDVLREGLR